MLQNKRITELHASLALPLVANASLVFLKRHLALSALSHALIDESVAANLVRLESFESALAKAEAEVCSYHMTLTMSQGLSVHDVRIAVCSILARLAESSLMESSPRTDADWLRFYLQL